MDFLESKFPQLFHNKTNKQTKIKISENLHIFFWSSNLTSEFLIIYRGPKSEIYADTEYSEEHTELTFIRQNPYFIYYSFIY